MVTQKSREELVDVGRNVSVQALVAQAHYTFGAAEKDGALAAELGPFLKEAQEALRGLEESLRDRLVASVVSKDANRKQDDAVVQGHVWRRQFVGRARMALHRGLDVPPEAGRMERVGRKPQAMAADIERLVKLGQDHLGKLAAVGTKPEFLKRGAEVARAVRAADELQEVQRGAQAPEAVRKMWAQAGAVYWAVKQVNDCALVVHASDRTQRRKYNMDILRRRPGSSSGPSSSPPPEGAPGVSPAGPLSEAS